MFSTITSTNTGNLFLRIYTGFLHEGEADMYFTINMKFTNTEKHSRLSFHWIKRECFSEKNMSSKKLKAESGRHRNTTRNGLHFLYQSSQKQTKTCVLTLTSKKDRSIIVKSVSDKTKLFK